MGMKISVCGSIHQKGTPKDLDILIRTILDLSFQHSVWIEERFYSFLIGNGYQMAGVNVLPAGAKADTDLLISIGGDGTFLRAAKLVAGTPARIIGVNSGRLGFLANVQPGDFESLWAQILSDQTITEQRDLLEVAVEKENGELVQKGLALNEVAVIKRDTASMITVDVVADGIPLATYEADGVLISTPTGSTAYALSVNGPIIHPIAPVFSILPVASHMLTMRPIVLPNTIQVSISVRSRSGTYQLACDGKSHFERVGDKVHIKLSEKKLNVLHPVDYSFYETLRNKLMWGKDFRL